MWILYLSSFGCRWKISYVCAMQMWALWMLISKSAKSWLAENRTTGWQDCQGLGICERKAEWSWRKWAREVWSEARAVAGRAAVREGRFTPDTREERAASKTGGNKEKWAFSWLYKKQDGAKKTILCYILHKVYSLSTTIPKIYLFAPGLYPEEPCPIFDCDIVKVRDPVICCLRCQQGTSTQEIFIGPNEFNIGLFGVSFA